MSPEDQSQQVDEDRFEHALGEYMRYHGVYASDLHIAFVSAVHTEDDADRIVRAYEASLTDMRAEGIL